MSKTVQSRAALAHAAMLSPLAWFACATGVSDASAPPIDGPVLDGGSDSGETLGRPIPTDAGTARSDEDAGDDDGNDSGDVGFDGAGSDDSGPSAVADVDTGAGGGDASYDAPACPCGPQSICSGAKCVPARRVFVSSGTYDGALGGHTGADATCETLATSADLGGTWMAWVSDSTSSPSVRFSKPNVAFVLLDGTLVASSWIALTASGPSQAIDLTETGVSLASASATDSKTWTGTLVDGSAGTASCSDFASNASTETGEVGHCTGTGTVNWTSAYTTEDCDVSNHIYCFEQ